MTARAETRQNHPPQLFSGNTWEFTPQNQWLTPSIYHSEYRDLSQTPQAAQRLVNGLIQTYVDNDWQFASLMGSDSGFAVVFVNPKKKELTKVCPHPTFLKPKISTHEQLMAWDNMFVLPTEPINELLVGTNLFAYNCFAAYNQIAVSEKRGMFKNPTMEQYYQSGVAYILANLHTVDEEMVIAQQGIKRIWKEYQDKVKPFQDIQEQMQRLRSTDPQPFLGK